MGNIARGTPKFCILMAFLQARASDDCVTTLPYSRIWPRCTERAPLMFPVFSGNSLRMTRRTSSHGADPDPEEGCRRGRCMACEPGTQPRLVDERYRCGPGDDRRLPERSAVAEA